MILSTSVSNAQGFFKRHSPAITVGAAAGSTRLSCIDCGAVRHAGITGFLRIGLALDSSWVVSAEGRSWRAPRNREAQQVEAILLAGQFYPFRKSGFYGDVGVGYGRVAFTDSLLATRASAGEVAFGVGMGYDIWLNRTFAVSPFVNSMWTSTARRSDIGGTGGSNLAADVLHIGVGATWRPSRNRYIPAGERP
jgi:hypothetical protein